MAEPQAGRDAAHGARITFSPKVFVPLTMLCRDRCGYCTFAKPPARLDAPYLTPDEVLAIARRGAALGCHEALFTLGEAPEDALPAGRRVARAPTATRRPSTTSSRVAQRVLDETGLLPHANAGALHRGRARAAARGEPVAGDDDRDARGPPRRARWPAPRRARQDPGAPARHARSRRAARACPFTTGILVGIGETRAERHRRAASRSRDAHARHGHVQEVIVQNFLPKPGTAMHTRDAVPARRVPLVDRGRRASCSPDDVHLQAPPNLERRPRAAARGRASTTGAASRRSRPTT